MRMLCFDCATANVQMEKASSAEDLLQMCLAALESESGEAGVRERLGLPAQDDGNTGKKKDVGAVQKALLQVGCCAAAVAAEGMPAQSDRGLL